MCVPGAAPEKERERGRGIESEERQRRIRKRKKTNTKKYVRMLQLKWDLAHPTSINDQVAEVSTVGHKLDF